MVALFLLSFVISAGNGAIFALLPQIQDSASLPDWSLGLIVASSFGAGLVAQLALARFADRGHVRKMVIGGPLVAATGYLAVGFGTELWSVAGGRAVAGLGIGMLYPAARKLLVARNPERAGQVLGRFLASDVSGFVLGAPIGALLANVMDVSMTFMLFAAVIVACVPFAARVRWVDSVESVQAARADRGVLRRLLGRRRLRAGLAMGAATFWAIGVFDTLWARYLTDLGSSAFFIGLTLACFGLPMAALAGLGGRLSDRFGPLPVGILSGMVAVPFMVGYGLVSAPMVLIALTSCHAIFDALNMPAAQATVVNDCAEHEIASGQGLLSSVQMSTAAISALVAAPVYDRFGAGAAFVSAAAVMVVLLGAAVHQARAGWSDAAVRPGLAGAGGAGGAQGVALSNAASASSAS